MGNKSLRIVAAMGLFAVVSMLVLMMFSLEQVTDTATPRIAADIRSEFERSLEPSPPEPVRLSMARAGKSPTAPRTYTLTLRPTAAVVADERALSSLFQHGAEMVAMRVGESAAEVSIRCVAELPEGGTRDRTFRRAGVSGPAIVERVESESAEAQGSADPAPAAKPQPEAEPKKEPGPEAKPSAEPEPAPKPEPEPERR